MTDNVSGDQTRIFPESNTIGFGPKGGVTKTKMVLKEIKECEQALNEVEMGFEDHDGQEEESFEMHMSAFDTPKLREENKSAVKKDVKKQPSVQPSTIGRLLEEGENRLVSDEEIDKLNKVPESIQIVTNASNLA